MPENNTASDINGSQPFELTGSPRVTVSERKQLRLNWVETDDVDIDLVAIETEEVIAAHDFEPDSDITDDPALKDVETPTIPWQPRPTTVMTSSSKKIRTDIAESTEVQQQPRKKGFRGWLKSLGAPKPELVAEPKPEKKVKSHRLRNIGAVVLSTAILTGGLVYAGFRVNDSSVEVEQPPSEQPTPEKEAPEPSVTELAAQAKVIRVVKDTAADVFKVNVQLQEIAQNPEANDAFDRFMAKVNAGLPSDQILAEIDAMIAAEQA